MAGGIMTTVTVKNEYTHDAEIPLKLASPGNLTSSSFVCEISP